MSHQNIFIGREDILNRIDEMVRDSTGANHVWRIVGEGGVGKTWLLREMCHRYESDPNILVIKIDHGQVRTHSLPAFTIHVLDLFGGHIPKNQHQEFRARISDLNNKTGQEREEIYKFGVSLMRDVGETKRILMIADTMEMTYNWDYVYQMNALGADLSNIVMISVGRPTQIVLDIYNQYPELYKNWIVHDIYELQPFSDSETTQYFSEFLPTSIPTDLHDKLFLLTGGNPVLISIAGEWLKRHRALPTDVDLPLAELQALDKRELAERREHFEFALVERMHDLRKPIEWALLYSAFLNRRYDPEILQLTLDLSDEELAEVTEELKGMAFVRQSISSEVGLLHDEAQRLILLHAWPVADPDGAIRREMAQQVIDGYYLPKIKKLSKVVHEKIAKGVEEKLNAGERGSLPSIPDEDWLKRELQLECLDYQFRADIEKGWAYLEQLITEAEDYHYSFIQIDAIEQGIRNLLYLKWLDPKRLQACLERISLYKRALEHQAI